MARERIHKVLSAAGVASRRAVEELIRQGQITVNGELVNRLPCFIDPASDDVRLDGRRLRLGRPTKKVYYLLNKPRGVVCTQSDPQGRPRAVDLVPGATERIYCVGRLDVESTGLLLLTNDGELTQTLTHPSNKVVKTYVVQIDGRMSGESLEQIKSGVYLDGKRTQRAAVKVLRRSDKQSLLEIRLSEGRNREIRRVLARMGHRVRRLKRTAIGRVTDRGVKIGNWRQLRDIEIPHLQADPLVWEDSAPSKARRVAKSKPAGKAPRPSGRTRTGGKGSSTDKTRSAGKTSSTTGKTRSAGKGTSTDKTRSAGKTGLTTGKTRSAGKGTSTGKTRSATGKARPAGKAASAGKTRSAGKASSTTGKARATRKGRQESAPKSSRRIIGAKPAKPKGRPKPPRRGGKN